MSDINLEERLIVPRTAHYLINLLGFDFMEKLPEGTVCGRGWEDGYRLFYWIPKDTKRQRKILNAAEVDMTKAKEVA